MKPRATRPVADGLLGQGADEIDGYGEAHAVRAAAVAQNRGVDADQPAVRHRSGPPPELPGLIGASVWMKSS